MQTPPASALTADTDAPTHKPTAQLNGASKLSVKGEHGDADGDKGDDFAADAASIHPAIPSKVLGAFSTVPTKRSPQEMYPLSDGKYKRPEPKRVFRKGWVGMSHLPDLKYMQESPLGFREVETTFEGKRGTLRAKRQSKEPGPSIYEAFWDAQGVHLLFYMTSESEYDRIRQT